MQTIAGGGQGDGGVSPQGGGPAKGKNRRSPRRRPEQASVERVVKSFESIQARMSASLGFTISTCLPLAGGKRKRTKPHWRP